MCRLNTTYQFDRYATNLSGSWQRMKDLYEFLLAFAVLWIDVLAPMALLASHGH